MESTGEALAWNKYKRNLGEPDVSKESFTQHLKTENSFVRNTDVDSAVAVLQK